MSPAGRSKGSGAGRGALKDPHGGLTAAGRAWFGRKQGAHLKPGVKKKSADMTPEDMRRKGSWAVRFYGREGVLPPLKKPNGEPSRYALSAAAWGEPVPTTVAAARRIAAKGHRLLAAHAKAKRVGAKSKSKSKSKSRSKPTSKATVKVKSKVTSKVKATTSRARG